MKASVIYRVASVLLVLFAAGHLIGFAAPPDPRWNVDGLIAAMRSSRFDVMGFNRTWWDFYLGAGIIVGIFYLFSAILAWRLGSLQPEALAQMRGLAWAFALAFAAITVVSWIDLFLIPILFSALITLVLIAGAWLASR